jgi:dTDP-4-amino-4,6-dideoxygalactose transaminase
VARSSGQEPAVPGRTLIHEDFLVFGSPLICEREIAEVEESLRSGWLGAGPKVQRFERMLEDYLGVEHVRCLSSCTAALTLAMKVLGIGPGDEVLVPTMTFVASANAVEHAGATPVFVDCEPDTWLIDLHAAARAITPRTKALIVVHLAGRPHDMDAVNAFRDRYSLFVLEDAAHAIGAEWHGKRIGAHGNLTAYSFYVTKNITTGEGGALATEDAAIAARVEKLALHGLTAGAWQRFSDSGFKHYECDAPGFKYNMTDIQAALGVHQLPRLDRWIDRRRDLWRRYDKLLGGLPLKTPAGEAPEARHARHLYQVLVDGTVERDVVLGQLDDAGIGVGVHYRAVHLHPYYRDRYELRPQQFPVASDMSERTISLPLSPKVTEYDQERVAAALADALSCS